MMIVGCDDDGDGVGAVVVVVVAEFVETAIAAFLQGLGFHA